MYRKNAFVERSKILDVNLKLILLKSSKHRTVKMVAKMLKFFAIIFIMLEIPI